MPCPVSREKAEHRCDLFTNSMFASSSRMGARPSSIIRSMRACAPRTLEIGLRWTRIVDYSRRAQLFPYRRAVRRTAQRGHTGIIGPFPQVGMQKESFRIGVRRPLFPSFRWWLCSAATPKQYQAVLSGTKTRDSPDTAEPPVEEDVALGGHSDRDHGVISRQPLGTPTLSKPMSRKSSNRLSSSPLHGSAASPILASRW